MHVEATENLLTRPGTPRLRGLIAAPFTPFDADCRVDVGVIPEYAEFLEKRGVRGVFVCGTTGEGLSLTVEERREILEASMENRRGLRVIAHIGHSSVEDSRQLASHAAGCGVDAIAAMPCSRLLPNGPEDLAEWCWEICRDAGGVPFYYDHIPSVSGVALPMHRFLPIAAERLPQLAGIKFTYEDLLDFQLCMALDGGSFDMSFGRDEMLLAGLSLGAVSAVGSTYNFASPLYLEIIRRFEMGQNVEARSLQAKAARLLSLCCESGGLPAIKAAMNTLGLPVGPCRLPLRTLDDSAAKRLAENLRGLALPDLAGKAVPPRGGNPGDGNLGLSV